MRDVEEEHEILRLQQVRLKEEAKTNPDVILSPREMAEKCMRKITDFRGMFEKFKFMPEEELAEWVTPEMLEEIDYAMTRQEGLGIPMFKQDFAYRLVKLNQVENTMWETDFIKKLYKMVKEIDANDECGEGMDDVTTTMGPESFKDATSFNVAEQAQHTVQFLSIGSSNKDNGQASTNTDRNQRNKVNFMTSEKWKKLEFKNEIITNS